MKNGVFAVLSVRRPVVMGAGVWYAAFAVYATGVALLSGSGVDHWWGAWAAGGYGLAALAAAAGRRRLGIVLALAGALAAPTVWLITQQPATPDVAVVARSGELLLHHGTPYLPAAALAAGGWLAYNPYLPVMALFGLPGALGMPGGTRPWLIGVTFLLLYATFRVTLAPGDARTGRAARSDRAARTAPGALETAAFWLASPIMALALAMGNTDPPVIALICLSLALLARGARTAGGHVRHDRRQRRDTVAAALILAVACAMKYTAWPALAIIAVMVATRDGTRAAARFTAAVLAIAAGLVVALAPAALRNPASILANTVAYPLGLTSAKSPAQSPLPGHLLAALGAGGHLAALVLLAAAGLATVAWLVISPPATPASAARRIAIGLAALFALSPATRFGYFIYPIAFYAWATLADRRGVSPACDDDTGSGDDRGQASEQVALVDEDQPHAVHLVDVGWLAEERLPLARRVSEQALSGYLGHREGGVITGRVEQEGIRLPLGAVDPDAGRPRCPEQFYLADTDAIT